MASVLSSPSSQPGMLDVNAQPELYVTGFPPETKAYDIASALEDQVGFAHQVLECTIKLKTRGGGSTRPFAFARVESPDVMRRVIDASQAGLGIRVNGRKLKVNLSNNASRTIRLSPKESISAVTVESFSIGVYMLKQAKYFRRWNSTEAHISPLSTKCQVNFDEQRMSLSFSVAPKQYLLEFSMLDMEYFVVSDHGSHCSGCRRQLSRHHVSDSLKVALCFALAPRVMVNSHMADSEIGDGLHYIIDLMEATGWQRTLDTFTSGGDILGQYFHFLLESGENTRHLARFLADLRHHYADFEEIEPDADIGPMRISILREEYNQLSFVHRSRFRELFQVEALVTRGLLYREMLSKEFFSLLHAEYALRALKHIDTKFEVMESPVDDLQAAMELARQDKDVAPRDCWSLQNSERQVWVYRLNITPLTTYAVGPEVDMPNRVLRHFSNLPVGRGQPPADYSQRFLRVHFLEENQTRLSVGSAEYPLMDVLEDVKNKLSRGIEFCGRHYEFLAMSNSQLRDHACWLFAPLSAPALDASEIRRWMGDFSGITNVAKYAARMGQCFSSTVTSRALSVTRDEWQMINDIKITSPDDKEYTFSDGIGRISEEFAAEATCSLNIKTGSHGNPSAFQIRFAGFKGVVAVCPGMPAGLKLQLRPSMQKFESDHMQLEVIQAARRFPGHLNREIILLLSTLGIEDKVFMDLQKAMVKKLDRVVINRQAARKEIGDNHDLRETYAITTAIHAMLESGFEPSSEPFLQSVLLGYRQNSLLRLEEKAHIDVEEGALLMGVLDESLTLNQGQVVIQSRRNGHIVPILGTVVIAKNPCLHPGDVRILQAVSPPPHNTYLTKLVDCLVFPAKGSRPHPNECSGSDLDGDQYFVTWDQRLTPLSSHMPADYEPQRPAVKHDITMADISQFFVDYMQNDALGPICHAHLALADQRPMKAKDPNCMELARMQSVAVDYPKTGIPVGRIPSSCKPKGWPDFMKKIARKSYPSQRVLGQLYRHIAKQRPSTMCGPENVAAKGQCDPDLLLEGYQRYEASAKILRERYNQDLLGIMKRYGTWKEEEAVGGYMVKIFSRHHRRQKLHDVQSQIRLETQQLRVHYYVTEFEGLDQTERLLKASAWYAVTYRAPPEHIPTHTRRHGRQTHRRLLSFAWIPYGDLCSLKSYMMSRRRR